MSGPPGLNPNTRRTGEPVTHRARAGSSPWSRRCSSVPGDGDAHRAGRHAIEREPPEAVGLLLEPASVPSESHRCRHGGHFELAHESTRGRVDDHHLDLQSRTLERELAGSVLVAHAGELGSPSRTRGRRVPVDRPPRHQAAGLRPGRAAAFRVVTCTRRGARGVRCRLHSTRRVEVGYRRLWVTELYEGELISSTCFRVDARREQPAKLVETSRPDSGRY